MKDHNNDHGNSERVFLSEVTNMVPGVVYQFYARPNGEMGFYYISPKSEQIIGLKPELDGFLERFIALIVPEQRDSFVKSIAQSVKESNEWNFEGMLQKPSGERIWFSGNSIPSPREGEIVFNGIIQDITVRKKTEESLKESELRFRCIVDCSPIAKYFYHLESDGRLILIGTNPSADRIIGIKHQELWGKTIEDAFPQLASTEIPAMYRKIAKGLLGNQSFDIPYKDDRFSGHYDVTVFQAGANHIVVDFVDISERKRTEEALKESEEQLRALFDNSKDAIGISKEGVAMVVNQAYLEMFGYTNLAEIAKRSILDQFSLKEHDRIKSYMEKRNAGQDVPKCYEATGIRKNGTEFPIELNVGTFVLHGQRFSVGIIRDITERKQAEEALRDSERHLKNSQTIAHLGSWRLDIATNQVMWTEELYNMYGFDPALPPPPYTEHMKLFVPESWERLSAAIGNTRETGIPYELELKTVKKDRSNGWMWVRGEAIKDSEGNTIGLWGAAQDISERKKAEEKHRKIEQQLQQTQKLESLGLLAGGIAHDFNNLMGGIFGYMDMANEESKDSKISSYLSKAMNTMERARALTQQLLTFAKGGAPIQKIDHLFPFVEETAKFALSGANVSCHVDVQPDLWDCNFDKNQIGQVIDNIIINAQQAMPVGGTIYLTARNITLAENEHPLLENGNYVKISMKDSGIGIPKELTAKIFDPFFTTKPKGHGLGLATCYSIIKRHGGCIDVESKPGKGSTFKVYLPASTEAASSVTMNTVKMHKGRGTFLVMDDEEVMRETISDMLKTLGYTVLGKENGKDALEFFSSENKANRTIAGLIFDLTVAGGMGGKAAIEEIRKTNKEIPAFVASGYADDPVMKNPTEYGFMASICKPFRKSELSEMLNKYMMPEK